MISPPLRFPECACPADRSPGRSVPRAARPEPAVAPCHVGACDTASSVGIRAPRTASKSFMFREPPGWPETRKMASFERNRIRSRPCRASSPPSFPSLWLPPGSTSWQWSPAWHRSQACGVLRSVGAAGRVRAPTTATEEQVGLSRLCDRAHWSGRSGTTDRMFVRRFVGRPDGLWRAVVG